MKNRSVPIPAITTGVSVILCCFNSAERIRETLRHLTAQQIQESLSWEVLLIDNGSTDGTAAIAAKIWNEQLPDSTIFRILQEPRAGQQFARIRGAREARYDLLIFCDDDNWLDPEYVNESAACMRLDERIGAAGGRNIPETNAAGYPDWFAAYADKYALGTPASVSGDITARGFILGAGMVTRKILFMEMYSDAYPSLLSGRTGKSLSTGDDFEYCKRLLLRGWRLYYNDRLLLRHFITGERLTIPYRDRLMEGIIEAGKVIHEYDLAIRVYNRYKNKNRWRLLLLTPFRIAMVRLGLMKRVLIDEELTWFYLSPVRRGNHPVRNKIKDFIYRRS